MIGATLSIQPRVALRALFVPLALLFVLIPADTRSLFPGIPLDFRVAGPVLVAAVLVAALGRPGKRECLLLGALCLVKLVLWPLTIQHGLIGSYYSTPDFSGPVEQVRVDQSIDFADDTFPIGYFNDNERFNFVSPASDRFQMPFSVRWTGFIAGGAPTLDTDQKAAINGSTITFSKAWGPHARLRLVGAGDLYPVQYSAIRIGLGNVVQVIQDVLAAVFGLVLLTSLLSVRLGWASLLFLIVAAQGYVRSWLYTGKTLMLAAGEDWLTYETQARDILKHGWLMNGGAPLFTGHPFYMQSFYAYYVALAHLLTGDRFAGIIFSHYLMLAASVALMFLLGKELFGRNAGVIASLLFLWFEQKYLLQYSDLLLTENMVYPLVIGGAYLFIRHLRTHTRGDIIGAGVLLGLAADTRSTVLTLVLIVVVVLLILRMPKSSLAFIIPAAAMMSFIVARNYLVSRQIAFLPTYGSINMYIAHTPPSDLHINLAPGADPYLKPVLEFLRQRPADFLRQAWSQTLLILALPDSWSWSGLAENLGVFLLWPLWLCSFVILRRDAWRWRFLALDLFIVSQLAATITFGLLAYGLRLALLAYLFLFLFAGLTMAVIVRNQAILRGGIVAGHPCRAPLSHRPRRAGCHLSWPTSTATLPLAAAQLPDEVSPGQTFDLALDLARSYTIPMPLIPCCPRRPGPAE